MTNVTTMPDQMTAAKVSGIQKQIADLRAMEAELLGNISFAVGVRLADRRKSAGDTAAEAAEKLEVKQGVINQIESRGAGLTLERFIAYCKVYKLDANEMLGLDNK